MCYQLAGSDSDLQTVDVVRHLLACLQADIRLLPVGAVAGKLTPAALLAHDVRGANSSHLHLEERLDSLLDFGLGRLLGNFEDQRVLVSLTPMPFR